MAVISTPPPPLSSVIELLGLEPLEPEGGFFKRTYLSSEEHAFWMGMRSLLSSIYYLVTPESYSLLHKLHSDEVYHFYCGDPLLLHEVDSKGAYHVTTLGLDLMSGQRPQAVVRAGSWQCSKQKRSEVGYTLLGTTVAPGFDFLDFTLLTRAEFDRWPDDLHERLSEFVK